MDDIKDIQELSEDELQLEANETESKLSNQEDEATESNAAEQEDPKLRDLQNAIREQAREDERPQAAQQTLRKILGGDFLTSKMIRSTIGVILLIVIITIIYVSNRYIYQKNMLEIDRLNTELQDAKFKALSSASELTEQCRESNVLNMLKNNKDSVLKIAGQPPYIINVPE